MMKVKTFQWQDVVAGDVIGLVQNLMGPWLTPASALTTHDPRGQLQQVRFCVLLPSLASSHYFYPAATERKYLIGFHLFIDTESLY